MEKELASQQLVKSISYVHAKSNSAPPVIAEDALDRTDTI